LADLEPRAEARDAEQETLRARMRQLDTERERLTAAIVQGGDLPTLVQALKEREQQRAQCRQRLDALARHPQPIAPRQLEQIIRGRLRDCGGLLERQGGTTRQILRDLLGGERITFTPHLGPEQRWGMNSQGRISLGGLLAGEVPHAMVTPAGFEPAISTLKGSGGRLS